MNMHVIELCEDGTSLLIVQVYDEVYIEVVKPNEFYQRLMNYASIPALSKSFVD